MDILGVTAAQVIAGAKAANIIYGVGSTVKRSSLYATSSNPDVQRLANTITGTIGDQLAKAGTVAVAQLGGPGIYVDPKKFKAGDYWQNLSIVFHEMLHNVTSLSDEDIQRKLKDPPYNLKEGDASDNITQAIKSNCF